MRNTENDKKTEKTAETNAIVQQKLAVFEGMRDDFNASFRFLEDVRGQRELRSLSLQDVVRYLHAIWIEERKSCLLSVARTVKEYEGAKCLDMLQALQNGEATSVQSFLNAHIHLPNGAEEHQQLTKATQKSDAEQRRAAYGYTVLNSYNTNLTRLLNALTDVSRETLAIQATEACQKYGHTLEQIAQQLQEMNSPLYTFVPSQELAQQNMLVMNMLTTEVLTVPNDVLGKRTNAVVSPTEPAPPLAEEVIDGYEELTSPDHNNINHDVFADSQEPNDTGEQA